MARDRQHDLRQRRPAQGELLLIVTGLEDELEAELAHRFGGVGQPAGEHPDDVEQAIVGQAEVAQALDVLHRLEVLVEVGDLVEVANG